MGAYHRDKRGSSGLLAPIRQDHLLEPTPHHDPRSMNPLLKPDRGTDLAQVRVCTTPVPEWRRMLNWP